jgi:regulator of replication initiation timing
MGIGKLGPKGWEVPTRAKKTDGSVEKVRAANNQLVNENNDLREKHEELMEANALLRTENEQLKGEDMSTRIKAALESLDPKDNSAWTEQGLPKVEAICQAVENNEVTRADIEVAIPGFTRPERDPAG